MSAFAAAAGEGKIEEITIFSNYGEKKIDLSQGTIELIITESILDNTVRVKYTYADTGYGNGRSAATIEKNDLNTTRAEKAHIVVSDAFGNKISFKDDYHLRVQYRNTVQETTRNMVDTTYYYSKESIDNIDVTRRVTKTYDGKIPNHVYDVLKNILKTPKKIYLDPGLNNFVVKGTNEAPFHFCTYLAKYCIPEFGPPGKYAGYLFWEISDDGNKTGGYMFKSIDKMTQQKPKLKLINTGTHIVPSGYDTNILHYSFDDSLRLDKLLISGAFTKTQLRTFSTYNNKYEENSFSDPARMNTDNMMGMETPRMGTDINLHERDTRIMTVISQDDVSNTGNTLAKQLEVSKGKYINFPKNQILRQSATRYNNLFSIRMSIVIPGRFNLHAGDIVFCDFPEISSTKTKQVSDKKSGLYMIVDVGHRISKNSCYTTLNLTRESIYRKG